MLNRVGGLAWGHAATGATGIAVWRHRGAIWVRQPSPPVLAGSPPAALESATAAAVDRGRTVVVGLETTLSGGGAHQRAVLWRQDGGGWVRLDLDTSDPDGTDSTATDVACADDGCLVVGRRDGALAGWRVTGDQVQPVDLPHRPVDRYLAEPRVALDEGRSVVAVGDGSGLLTRRAGGPWTASTTPAGLVRGLGVYQDTIILLVRNDTGEQQLYQRR